MSGDADRSGRGRLRRRAVGLAADAGGWRARVRPALRESALPAAYFLLLSLLVFGPLLGRGYVLTLDMIFGPHTRYVDFVMHTKGPLYYGRLPFAALLDAATFVVDDWIVQNLLLVALPVCCGLAAYSSSRLFGVSTRSGALFAGTLYALNPFVYVRLLAGHWYFLYGYAFLPLAVVGLDRYLADDDRRTLWPAVGWAAVVSIFDPHAAILLAVAGGCLFVVRTVDSSAFAESRPVVADGAAAVTVTRRFATYAVGCALANAFWVVPAVVASAGGGTRLTTISGPDLAAFSAAGTVAGNVPLSAAMLYGFWRGGALTTVELLPAALGYLLFATLVYLAVNGVVRNRSRPAVVGCATFGVVGFVLALGVSTPPSEPLVRWLASAVPVFRGMRDTQKFAGLLALSYAFLGALRVESVVGGLAKRVEGSEGVGVDRRAAAGIGLTLLVLAVPVAYAAPMLGGFSGQLDATTYPETWHEANRFLAGDDAAGTGRVLVLPWHQYVRYDWTGRTVATPAQVFFENPVVVGHNLEVGGVDSHATDPTHAGVRRALDGRFEANANAASDAREPASEQLADYGVEYLLVTHDADYERYGALATDPHLSVAYENRDVTIYRNEADAAASGGPWPRAGPPVPEMGLGVGGAISVLACLAVGGGRRFR